MTFDIKENIDIAWCPGCGNFPIRKAIIQALEEMGMSKKEAVIVAGIGQAAKMPQYLDINAFSGLHGRAMAVAFGIKASNPSVKVIVEGGDGDMYAEGGNHFIHNIRRNIDVAHLVHNNMVYGLTKGQASPTSQEGFKTPLQVDGVILEPFNPLTIALSAGATFVARAFSSDIDKTKEIIKKAINHKGYALVDIFQPCVSFNKVNTHKWYKENSYYLEDDYDNTSFENAYKKALESEKYPLGVLYKKEKENSYTENHNVYINNKKPIIERERDIRKVNKLINS